MKKILIIAGEVSGDIHAANLVRAMKKKDKGIKYFAVGGSNLKKAGCEIIDDINNITVVGLIEVIKKFPHIRKLYKRLVRFLDKENPDAVILVDYPGFNLKFSSETKKRGIKTIFFISPQIWAWHYSRINIIKRNIDLMIVILTFEEELYKKENVPVKFIGHPLIDIVSKRRDIKRPVKNKILLLPGSRMEEVKTLLPDMLEICKILLNKYSNLKISIIKAETIDTDIIKGIIDINGKSIKSRIKIHSGNRYKIIADSDFALVASGTATLETCIVGVPMAVMYRVNWFTYIVARMLVKISHISLVNLIAGYEVVPEYIQHDIVYSNISDYIIKLFSNNRDYKKKLNELIKIRAILGKGGVSGVAAREVIKLLKGKRNEKRDK